MNITRLARATLLGAAVACIAALTGCASLRAGADRAVVRDLERRLAADQGEELAELSQVPFLLDGEVVVLPEDVSAFWRAVAGGAWSLAEGVVTQGTSVDVESYRAFAATREAAAFFKNYVGKGSRLIELTTSDGGRVLILVQEKLFSRKLLGMATR